MCNFMQKISHNFPCHFVHNYHMNVFGESNSWSTEGGHCCDVRVLILKQRLGQVKGHYGICAIGHRS